MGWGAGGQRPELGELPRARPPRAAWADRLLAELGGAVDATILCAAAVVVERALIPTAADLAELRASSEPLLDPALHAAPRRFFAFLDEPAPAPRVETRTVRAIAGGRVLERRLRSAYRPYVGAEPKRPSGPVLLEHWMHERGRARATALLLHGFGMGRPRLDAAALLAPRWFEAGLDVALLVLPHHGARTPVEARLSGQAFAVPHVARLAEAVREAIHDVALSARWLREASDAPVGLLGLSLGGYLTALAAGLLDDLAFAVPMAAPVCMGDLAWRFFRRTKHARAEGALTAFELRRSFRVHSPLAHPLRIARERALVVAGRGDRVVPASHAIALARHWGGIPVHWFAGSHLAPFGRAGVADAVTAHLRRLDVL